jgi:gas vesicle protein
MSDDRGNLGTSLLIFLAGAAVGAAVVALTTPKTGAELRNDLREAGGKIKDQVTRLKEKCCCEEEEKAQA